jgi:uncharacterized protein (TIGR00730 family)
LKKLMPNALCVYCSSSDRLAPKYYTAATWIGNELARRRWTLVYGGGRTGLMGAVARGTKTEGGRVIGIIPEFMKTRELAYADADELISVVTMRDRKLLMEDKADAFLALPGGWGTLEETLEILTLAHLEAVRKPIVIFNQNGYYDELLALFDRIIHEGFMHDTIRQKFAVAREAEEIFPLLENWSNETTGRPWFGTK